MLVREHNDREICGYSQADLERLARLLGGCYVTKDELHRFVTNSLAMYSFLTCKVMMDKVADSKGTHYHFTFPGHKDTLGYAFSKEAEAMFSRDFQTQPAWRAAHVQMISECFNNAPNYSVIDRIFMTEFQRAFENQLGAATEPWGDAEPTKQEHRELPELYNPVPECHCRYASLENGGRDSATHFIYCRKHRKTTDPHLCALCRRGVYHSSRTDAQKTEPTPEGE